MKELHSNLIKIIDCLNDGSFHSGDEIGKKIGITRSAVWKAIKKLEFYGIAIDSVKNKGYALKEPLALLDQQRIKKQLKTTNRSLDIKVLASINSTNDYLREQPASQKIRVCIAETQTQGRGRLNRCWYSPFGKNIYFSCRYPFQKDISEMAGLSLVVGLVMLKTIREFITDSQLAVQWPCHIVWNNKKLAGTLIELNAEANGRCEAIIGIGVNINLLAVDGRFPWVSMQQILGKYLDRNAVCIALANHLIQYLQKFEQQGFSPFKQEWLDNDGLFNQVISLQISGENVSGQVKGINDLGHLLLQMPNNEIHHFAVGEVIRNNA